MARSSKKIDLELSTPPNSLESEQALLASILIDSKSIDEVVGSIDADDFYTPANGFIYSTLVDLHKIGKPLDLVTLTTRLTDIEGVDKAGGFSYVTELVQIIPNSANILAYANNIKEKALLRRMIHAGSHITELGYNRVEPVEELLDEAQSTVYKLGEDKAKKDPRRVDSIIDQHYKVLEELYKRDNDDKNITGVPSGFKDIDNITNGFQNSDLIIIAGRPGMGKTSFGLNMMFNASIAGKSCVFFSLEMPNRQILNRIISAEAQINFKNLRTGNLNSDEWKRMGDFSSKLSKLNIYIDDSESITVNQIRSKCRKLKNKNGLDIIFIDYLQIMGYDKSIVVREQQISEISRSLKALAKELDVPIIAFAQVNRAVEHRTDNKPFLSDLRESGAIEQDADIIMFLYRDAVYNKNSIYQNVAEITIAKHRNGETGSAYISFEPQFTQFGRMPIDTTYLRTLEDAKKQAKKSKD